MIDKSLLIINDVTGYGRVSSFAMLPVFASYGIHAYVLPTALVSNTMDYGSAEILDTTAFMKKSIAKWKDFGFGFSNIATGLINSAEQAEIICNFIDSQQEPFVIVDPIMADDGVLYPDMYEGAVSCNRKLATRADVLVPNITEATMLADMYVGKTELSDNELQDVLSALSALGPKNIVITGCHSSDENYNLVYKSETGETAKVPYEIIPGKYVGTGDVFSAALVSELINGTAIEDAVNNAAQIVSKVVNNNINNEDHYDLYIENIL